MGYTTVFWGSIKIAPPLDAEEIKFLRKFAATRRVEREKGPYYVDDKGKWGMPEADVINMNRPPPGQPNLWCRWVPTEDGTEIVWDERGKFYDADDWMIYIIEHFLKSGALATGKVWVIKGGHVCNGEIEAEGEDRDDVWKIVVKDNVVEIYDREVSTKWTKRPNWRSS